MPVKKVWYKVDAPLLNKKIKDGIVHYLVKYSGYKNPSWQPYFNIGTDLISGYEMEQREKANRERQLRVLRRRIKREIVPAGKKRRSKW